MMRVEVDGSRRAPRPRGGRRRSSADSVSLSPGAPSARISSIRESRVAASRSREEFADLAVVFAGRIDGGDADQVLRQRDEVVAAARRSRLKAARVDPSPACPEDTQNGGRLCRARRRVKPRVGRGVRETWSRRGPARSPPSRPSRASPGCAAASGSTNSPMMSRRCVISIIIAITGTATTPLITALQNSALIGSIGDEIERRRRSASPTAMVA